MLRIEFADELDRFLFDFYLEADQLSYGVHGFAQFLLKHAHVAAVEDLLLLVFPLELFKKPRMKPSGQGITHGARPIQQTFIFRRLFHVVLVKLERLGQTEEA